ncbi:hypothetical protein HN695_01605 [Candidatus Woesearchaeota archaeon]|nr:hypothetical protein [Candidatus Woesearchaeota archaeon]MBT5273095.1 hypothetical protein [Candidatus Woesearchaeota archaeon]MBT6337590.1 hypothetical protein [Candidatus Woesearchaeota archaeon]MBT7927009.1 hypothetical protein [Candidatus Woesearchaeota archaeon]
MGRIIKKGNNLYTIALILFFLSVASQLITLGYPIPGDSVVFADITEKFHNQNYITHISESALNKVLPLYSFISSIFMSLTNAPDAIRLLSILSSSLTIVLIYLFARAMKLSTLVSILVALLVLFNPWYFYYTSTLPLTESLSVFLVTFAYFLYYLEHRYLSAIFFSLSIMTRHTNALFVIPICFLYFLKIFRSCKNNKHNKYYKLKTLKDMYPQIKILLLFSLIVFSPFVLWMGYNSYNQVDIQDTDYVGHLELNPNKGLSIVPVYFQVLGEYILKVLPIMFLFLLPLIIINYFFVLNYKKCSKHKLMEKPITKFWNKVVRKVRDKEKVFWILILIAFLLHLLFYSWWVAIMVDQFFQGIWEKIRYLVLFIPLFTLMAFRFDLISLLSEAYKKINKSKSYKKRSGKYKKVYCFMLNKRLLCFILLLIFISLTGFVNLGFVKDHVDKVIPSKSIYAQRSWHQHQAISLFYNYLGEQEIQKGVVVIGVLSKESEMGHINYYLGDYFNKGSVKINYIALKTQEKLTNKEVNTTIQKNNNYFEDKLVFIFSEFSKEDTINRLKEYSVIEDIKIKKVIQTKSQPFVSLFSTEGLYINKQTIVEIN